MFAPGDEDTAKKDHLDDHAAAQAEKLLSKPILIPRNPWAIITQIIALVFISDIVIALLLFASSAFTATMSLGTVMLIAGSLLIIKGCLVTGVVVKMSLDWVPDSYEITERQLIKKGGVATKEDKVYELTNIRHVTVHQNFVGRQLEYGDIELLVATAGLNETIKLCDVKDPHHFEEVFTEYMG